jgi:hypothetical protein
MELEMPLARKPRGDSDKLRAAGWSGDSSFKRRPARRTAAKMQVSARSELQPSCY